MTTPRFHPGLRIFWCGAGLLAIFALVQSVLLAGHSLSTAFVESSRRESFGEMLARFALPVTLLTYSVCLVWLSVCRQKWDRATFLSLGLRPITTRAHLFFGALCGFLATSVFWTTLWGSGAIAVQGYSPKALEMGALSVVPLVGYFLAFCAVACFEEILFRGYLLHNLNAWGGWRFAVGAQAAIFALAHCGNVLSVSRAHQPITPATLPGLFLIGVFFALSYRKTGSLWFAIAFHTLWNFSLCCLFSLPVSVFSGFHVIEVKVSPDSLFGGGGFGAEASVFLPFLLFAMIWFLRQSPNHPQAILDLALLQRRDAAPNLTCSYPAQNAQDQGHAGQKPARENRFKTKFGTQTGFDPQLLCALRELQRARQVEEEAQPQKTYDALSGAF